MIRRRGDWYFSVPSSPSVSLVPYKPPFHQLREPFLLCRWENRLVPLLVDNTLLKQLSLRHHARRFPLLLRPSHEHKRNEANDRQINKLRVMHSHYHHIATLTDTFRQFFVVETVVRIPTMYERQQRNIVAIPEHSRYFNATMTIRMTRAINGMNFSHFASNVEGAFFSENTFVFSSMRQTR